MATEVNTPPTTVETPFGEQPTLVNGQSQSPIDQAPTVALSSPSQAERNPDHSIADEELARKLQIQVVDVSHGVVAHAIDKADAHLAEQTSQAGFKGFIKRIWLIFSSSTRLN